MYFKGAKGIILAYDATSKDSFTNILKHWKFNIEEYADENVNVVLIGNKRDARSKTVKPSEGKKLAVENGW